MELDKLIGDMKVVTVSGAHKGVGKTTLAELLLQKLPGFAAIKITLDDLYTSVSDREEEIMVPGKDTFRMKRSGAQKVVWVRTTEKLLPDAVETALSMIGTPQGLLIEGNSILNYLNPTVAFFVIDASIKQMKPSRFTALKKAHLCIINRKNGMVMGDEIISELSTLNPNLKFFLFDLSLPYKVGGEALKDLEEYLKIEFRKLIS